MEKTWILDGPKWLKTTWLIGSVVVCVVALSIFAEVKNINLQHAAQGVLVVITILNAALMGTAETLQKEAKQFNRPGHPRTVTAFRILACIHLVTLLIGIHLNRP